MALLLAQSVALACSQSATVPRSYRVGAAGTLEMTVPSSWLETAKTLDKPPSATLSYRLPSRTDFYMKVTAVWLAPEARASREAGWVKSAVEENARALVGDQKPLTAVMQISSPSGSGYYYQSPGYDRLPVGEFTYITDGVLDLGEAIFIFTAYSNTKDLTELADALRVVESARFVAGKT